MSDGTVPQELLKIRDQIDDVDRRLVALLAERFALTARVGELKANRRLEAVDPEREARKLAAIRALCAEHGLNPDLVSELFTHIMAEAVKNHRRLQGFD